MKEKRKLLNEQIRAKNVQVITDNWENLWVMETFKALSLAQEQWLDLIEIWKNWKDSIVKIIDYWKYLYRQKKQEQKQKQKWKAPDMKTLRITYKISEHDLDTKKRQALKFAKSGHPLRVILILRWRENHYTDVWFKKVEQFIALLDEYYKQEWEIKKSGHTISAMLTIKK